jgi:hypothetical protein
MDAIEAAREALGRIWAWPTDERNARRVLVLWAIAVFLLAFAVYAPKLHTPPDGYDETAYLYMLSAMSWRSAGPWCIWPYETFPYFRPLGFASLALDRLTWGRPHVHYLPNGQVDTADVWRQGHDWRAAFPYRLTNLLIYAAGCVAFGLMVGQLGRSRALGFIAGPAYALSPQNRITVLYYPERFILLVALFSFLAVFLFLRRLSAGTGGRREAVLSVALFAAALASKEHAIVVPVLLALWALLLAPRTEWRKAIAPLAGMAGVLVAYLSIRYEVLGFFFRNDMANVATWSRFRTLPVEIILGAPWGTVQPFPCFPPTGYLLLTSTFWSAVIAFAAFWGSAYILLRRQWRLLVAFALWMPLMYAPIAHAYAFDLFPYKLYLPNASYPLLMSLALWQWGIVAQRQPWRLRLLVILGMAYVAITWLRR